VEAAAWFRRAADLGDAIAQMPLAYCYSCDQGVEQNSALGQGLTLVHFSAQREHFLSHVVRCFVGLSDKNGPG